MTGGFSVGDRQKAADSDAPTTSSIRFRLGFTGKATEDEVHDLASMVQSLIGFCPFRLQQVARITELGCVRRQHLGGPLPRCELRFPCRTGIHQFSQVMRLPEFDVMIDEESFQRFFRRLLAVVDGRIPVGLRTLHQPVS